MSLNMTKILEQYIIRISNFVVSDKFIFSIMNFCFITIAILIIYFLIEMVNKKYKEDKMRGKVVIKINKESGLLKIKYLKKMHSNLKVLLIEKGKEGSLNIIFNSLVIAIAFIMFYLIFVNQIVLAIISPFVLIKFVNKIMNLLNESIEVKIEDQLPELIDSIIRVSSKYSDLRTIIYESSRNLNEPIKGMFDSISRQMTTGNSEEVLMEFAYGLDNVWVYSLVFTLISYTQDSNKEDTKKNLRNLRNLLEKEINLRRTNVNDKRYGVVINTSIGLIGLIGLIGNLIINPNAKIFFFSTISGLICFVLGILCLMCTVIINIKMSKVKRK